jgi:hypothetical protein
MSEAISRETFDELKSYLGVYLQQGRPILDADWNEGQEILTAHLRRLRAEALGDGSPNRGFKIDPVFPPPPSLLLEDVDTSGGFEEALGKIAGACIADLLVIGMYIMFGPLLFFLQFPGDPLESFDSVDDVELSSTQGTIRIGRDRPAEGEGFLRLSGHPGTVTVTKTLTNLVDLSAYELATFKYRLNAEVPGPIGVFLEDDTGNRSEWRFSNPALARDIWLPGFAAPLNLRFHVLTRTISFAVKDKPFSADLATFAGTTPMTWTLDGGALPAGLTLEAKGPDADSSTGRLTGTPTEDGTFAFTAKVTDATGLVATQAYDLVVKATGDLRALPLPSGIEFLSQVATTSTPTGTGADLSEIRKYGFELYQDPATPLVWDLDDVRLASSELEDAMGRNNFIIRGSELASLFSQLTLMSILGEADDDGSGGGNGGGDDTEAMRNLLDLINTQFQLSEPDVSTAGRFYAGGLPVLQVEDVLYSEQADPNDPPLSPPPAGVTRTDAVYLDVWTEPVTYVDDPRIRDVALGGPDTGTRRRARHQVRVAQGGAVPTGDGIGDGTLATEGDYTAQANRLYRVEIETPGDIGTATFRWSDDNASTILRVIEPVPPGSTTVVVEDAAALHTGDLVLLKKDHGEERHEVTSVSRNVVTLKDATGSQLDQLPAGARPGFTTFALADRPALQRWNAFGQAIGPDLHDATVSGAIGLEDGVQIRFGGHGMRRGDYWTFATRYLAGDEATGMSPVTRIERLDFQRARGVRHHYAPLASLRRDGDADEPDRIFLITERRTRVANAGTTSATMEDLTGLTGTATVHLGGMSLPPCGLDSKFVIFWSGDLFLDAALPSPEQGKGFLRIRVAFYGEGTTDPATEPSKGHIQDRQATVSISRRQTGVDIPLRLIFEKSDTDFLFLPRLFAPTSVHVFADLDQDGFTVQLTGMQLLALELKKGY